MAEGDNYADERLNGTASPRAASLGAARPRAKHAAAGDGARTKHYAIGVGTFGVLAFLAGATPWALPAVFVGFVLTGIPWRAVSFYHQKWAFFLIDFCYFANIAVAAFLLFAPNDAKAEALVYALADGPLAGALVAWQCAWVFGDWEHTASVMMHLLPGLAVFANRYFTPPELRGWRGLLLLPVCILDPQQPRCGLGGSSSQALLLQQRRQPVTPENVWFWLLAAPLLFYLSWQLVYFLIVQVLFRGFIKRRGHDTSYNCLARRAAKTDNFWNRLVRKGSIARRISMYGLLQLAFTVISLTAFLPTYFSCGLALVYQVIKTAFPIYHGGRHQCEKLPALAVRKALGIQRNGSVKLHAHSHAHARMQGHNHANVHANHDGIGGVAAAAAAAADSNAQERRGHDGRTRQRAVNGTSARSDGMQ